MTCWALIPVKNFRLAKTRLAGVLNDDQRRRLAKAMFLDTMSAVFGSTMIDGVSVVTDDPIARKIAIDWGAAAVKDDGIGLNPALENGRTMLFANGASRLLVLPADIPAVQGRDVDRIVEASKDHSTAIITCDLAGQGTNALLVSSRMTLPFCFGPASYERHTQQAAEAGVDIKSIKIPAIANDCDRPADLALMKKSAVGKNTRQVLDSWDQIPSELVAQEK